MKLKALVEARFEPDHFYYHLLPGGHVRAIHLHRIKRYSARIDFSNFFYSIDRNRVMRALQDLGLSHSDAESFAKWSTVKNPLDGPSYSLPYGFIQSPLLASLVLSRSPIGIFLREMNPKVQVSVYVDDIALSSNNFQVLDRAFRKLRRRAGESRFPINNEKSCEPGLQMQLFNCHLEQTRTFVTEDRKDVFYSQERSGASIAAFEEYCEAIAKGNAEIA